MAVLGNTFNIVYISVLTQVVFIPPLSRRYLDYNTLTGTFLSLSTEFLKCLLILFGTADLIVTMNRSQSPPRRLRACAPCSKARARCHFKPSYVEQHLCDRYRKTKLFE